MRKINLVSFAVAMTFAMALVGCGGTTSTESSVSTAASETVSTTVSVKEEEKEPVKEEKTEENSMLANTYKIAGKNIYLNVPAWQEIEAGRTEIFREGELVYINLSLDKNGEANSVEDAFSNGTSKMIQNLENFFLPQEVIVDKSEIVTINGVEMFKYEGHINCGESQPYEAPCFGYSMIIDGASFDINGSVHGQDGDTYTVLGSTEIQTFDREAAIKEVKELVDEMAKTVRTEE